MIGSMAYLYRVKARWSGFTGAPGYSVLHFREFGEPSGTEAAAAVGRVRLFFDDIKTWLPAAVSVLVEPEVEVIEDTTGELMDSLSVTPVLAVPGLASGNFSAATGAVVNWRTSGIRNGRRVRGRTFLVPLAAAAFSTGGQLSTSSVNQIVTAATKLSDGTLGPDLMVYGRPTNAAAADGVAFVVSSVSVPATGAILTSRRD
jgi:hypothetical protein